MPDISPKNRQSDRDKPTEDKRSLGFTESAQKTHNTAAPRPETPLNDIRNLVGAPFVALLKKLKWKTTQDLISLDLELNNFYSHWAEDYQLIHKNFADLWDFFHLIEKDSEGWHRVSPAGSNGFVNIGEQGYSFCAGVENNHTKGAPLPPKWLIVSFAYSQHWANGIGDERGFGRPEPINDILIGLKNCKISDLNRSLAYSRNIAEKIRSTPIIFQMYSEKVGQKGAKIDLKVLQTHNLTNLCKGLFVALNNDVLNDFQHQLPSDIDYEVLKS